MVWHSTVVTCCSQLYMTALHGDRELSPHGCHGCCTSAGHSLPVCLYPQVSIRRLAHTAWQSFKHRLDTEGVLDAYHVSCGLQP